MRAARAGIKSARIGIIGMQGARREGAPDQEVMPC